MIYNIDQKKLDVSHIIGSYKNDPIYPTKKDFLYDIIQYLNKNNEDKISKQKIYDIFEQIDKDKIDKIIVNVISENIFEVSNNYFYIKNNILN